MKKVPEKIVNFLNENRIASVCFLNEENKPYCISCFFVFYEEENTFIFKSSFGSGHDKVVQRPVAVSGTILPEKFDILNIKGIQYTGKILTSQHAKSLLFNGVYYKKYPAGLVLPGQIWAVKIDFLKFTDNTLGFGNKTIWQEN